MPNETRINQLNELLDNLQIKGNINRLLVHQALTHPSYLYEEGRSREEHNQRLEFLGDAILGLVVAKHLYQKYPHKSEGELTKMRAAVVCESSLCQAARKMDLGRYLLLGKGEELMGGAKRASNLADCFEALMGALYLSVGLEKVSAFLLRVLKEQIKTASQGQFDDYKTKFQEYAQRTPKNKVTYRILHEDGPDHNKNFLAAVYLNEEELAQGNGHTKKEAEQAAAKLALSQFGVI